MEDEKYYRKYVRSNFRRNLAKHDDFYTSNKNIYRIHLHLSPIRMWLFVVLLREHCINNYGKGQMPQNKNVIGQRRHLNQKRNFGSVLKTEIRVCKRLK